MRRRTRRVTRGFTYAKSPVILPPLPPGFAGEIACQTFEKFSEKEKKKTKTVFRFQNSVFLLAFGLCAVTADAQALSVVDVISKVWIDHDRYLVVSVRLSLVGAYPAAPLALPGIAGQHGQPPCFVSLAAISPRGSVWSALNPSPSQPGGGVAGYSLRHSRGGITRQAAAARM